MYAPGATEADAQRYRALAAEQAARVPLPPSEQSAPALPAAPPPTAPRRRVPRPLVVAAAVGVAAVGAVVLGTLAGAHPTVPPTPTPTPTLARHVEARPVPLSDDAPSLAEALAFDDQHASTIAASLDRALLTAGRSATARQATALALGPWVLALDDLDAERTASWVTVVVHCGVANRYDWQLDGTHPGSTRTHIVATGSGSCDGDASAATVGLATGEAPARLTTTVRVNRAYVVDVIAGR